MFGGKYDAKRRKEEKERGKEDIKANMVKQGKLGERNRIFYTVFCNFSMSLKSFQNKMVQNII